MKSFLPCCFRRFASRHLTLLTLASVATLPFISGRPVFGQAGNAIAVGVAAQDMTQSAANQSTQNIGSSGTPTGSQSPPGSQSPTSSSPSGSSPTSSSPTGSPPDSSGYPSGSSDMRTSPSGYPSSSESGYGSPDGSYGNSGYGNASGAPGLGASLQLMSSMFSSQIASSAAEMFAGSDQPRDLEVSRLSLWDQAALAFYTGDQNRAMSLFHAHILADGQAAEEARGRVSFSRDLRRPLWQVRFGISTHVRLPDGFASGPEPIREGMKLTGVAGRRNSAGGGGYVGESSPSSPNGSEMAMSDSRDPNNTSTMSPGSSIDPSGYGNTAPKPVIIHFGGSAMADAQQTVDGNLGLVATVFREMFDKRQSTGKFGQAFDGMQDAADKLIKQSTGYSESPLTALPMWSPGIDYVGDGPYASMLETAKANRLDYLLHFEVAVKENRLGSPAYLTRCKLMNVETGETLGLSKAIDKYEVVDAKGGMRAAIETQLMNLFEIVDKRAVVEKMPTLQPQQAVTRVDSLLSTGRLGKLRSLAEISMLHSQKLLTDQQLNQCVFYLAGDKGLKAMHDAESSRYEQVLELVEDDLTREKK